MEDTRGSLHRAGDRRRIAQISRDVFEGKVRDRAIGAGRTQHHTDVFASRNQLARDMAAEEAGSACDKGGHAILTPSSPASACKLSVTKACSLCNSRVAVCDKITSSTCSDNWRQKLLRINRRASAALGVTASSADAAVISQPSTSFSAINERRAAS